MRRAKKTVEQEGRYVAKMVPSLAVLAHVRQSGQHLLLTILAEPGRVGPQSQGVDTVTESHGSPLRGAPALQRL